MFSRYAAPAKLPISVLFPNEGSRTLKSALMSVKSELGMMKHPEGAQANHKWHSDP